MNEEGRKRLTYIPDQSILETCKFRGIDVGPLYQSEGWENRHGKWMEKQKPRERFASVWVSHISMSKTEDQLGADAWQNHTPYRQYS